MKQQLKECWQAWAEVWTAVRACHAGRNEKLVVQRTGQFYDPAAQRYRERFEFRLSDNGGWTAYQKSRNLLEVRVPRLSKLLAKFKLI